MLSSRVNMAKAKEGVVISRGLEETGKRQQAIGRSSVRMWRGSARTQIHGRLGGL